MKKLVGSVIFLITIMLSVTAFADASVSYTGLTDDTARVSGAGEYKTVLITKDSDSSIVYVDQMASGMYSGSTSFLLTKDPAPGKYKVTLGSATGSKETAYFYVGLDPTDDDVAMTRLGEDETAEGKYNVGFYTTVSAEDYNNTYKTLKVGTSANGKLGGFPLVDGKQYTTYNGDTALMLIFQLNDVSEEQLDSVTVFLSKNELE